MTRRRFAAFALAAAAAIALLGAVVTGYANRAFFDADQFATRASAALDNDAVTSEAAKRVTDQLVAAQPNLVAVRPVLEGVVGGIVGGGAFQDVFRAGVADLHRAVFEQDENTVTLTLADIGATVRGTLAAVNPKLAKKIPAQQSLALVDGELPAPLAAAVSIADTIRWLPLLLLLIAVGLGGGAVRLASDARNGWVAIGAAISLIAVLAIVGLNAARAILLTSIDSSSGRDAAAGVWDAFVGDLETAIILLAICGAVIAAAASSLLRPVDIGAQLGRAWAIVTTAPQRPGWRVVRAIALIVAGVLIILRNNEFLSLLATLIGIYIAYAGVAELMRLTTASPQEAVDDQRRGRAVIVAVGVTAGVILGLGALFIGVGGLSERSLAIQTEGCNGSEALCDRALDDVAIAATHNSMSAASNPGWFFAQQEKGIAQQLRDGIHGLLIDAHYGIETQDGTIKTDLSDVSNTERQAIEDEIGPDALEAALRIRDRIVASPEVGSRGVYFCHGFCEVGALPIDGVFGDITDFLAANPDEVLVIVIEDYVDPADIAAAAQSTGLLDYVYKGPITGPLPTLEQMIDSGGRVLMLAENDAGNDAFPWYHLAYDSLLQETPYSFQKPAQLTDPAELPASCEPNRGPASAPLFLVNHWIDTSPAPRPSNAAKVNTRRAILDRVHACEDQRDLLANLIAVDFYREGDIFGAVDELNGERSAQTAP
jgi:hypothetical protein